MQMRQREGICGWVGNVIATNVCVSYVLVGCGKEVLEEFQAGFGSLDAFIESDAARIESVLVAA